MKEIITQNPIPPLSINSIEEILIIKDETVIKPDEKK